MCGIAGVFEFRPGAVTAPNVLESMAKMIEHRGPDQGAVFQTYANNERIVLDRGLFHIV